MARRTRPQWKADEQAFAVTVRVLCPENGMSAFWRDIDPDEWLRRTLGRGEFAATSLRSAIGDGVQYHFRCLEDARRFLDRFPQMVLADSTMAITYCSPDVPFGRREVEDVCNLYSHTRAQDAMRQLMMGLPLKDRLGNLPEQPEIYPDQFAPIIRHGADGLEAVMARWGMPTPPQFLIGKKTDRGVTNIRNTKSPHWRRWLGPEHRCLVPFTAFAEPDNVNRGNAWFALSDDRPAFFAGLHVPSWTSVRKLKDGQTTDDLFGFLTTEPNALVAAIHPKAMPVILTEPAEWQVWLTATWAEAVALQRPLSKDLLLRA